MASITATGLGSGLDIESIINGLMRVEQIPLTRLQDRQSEVDAKISAYGELKSALSSFNSAMSSLKTLSAFEVYTATSSDEDIFTATADSSAVPGSYTIDFSQAGHQLAQSHKMISTSFADATTSTGASGTLKIEHATLGTSFNIIIDTNNDTLNGIRDEINSASDNIGVTATIINVDGGSKLVLTSDETGTDSTITLSDVSGNVSTTLSMATQDSAQDAIFSLDGNTVTSQTNVIQNAIEGVDITLLKKATSATTLTVANDAETVKENINSFVDAYNEVVDKLSSLRAGDLSGDNSLISIESSFRSIFNTVPSGLVTSLKYLADIGITTDENGKFSFDSSKLDDAINSDFDGVAELLADNDQGYVYRLESAVDDFISTDGVIAIRTNSLNGQSDDLDDDIANMEFRLDLIEQRLRSQFSNLDTLLSGLNATSNYLSQQLGQLPGAG